MHGGDEGRGLPREDREREVVEMEMQDIELAGAAAYLLQHRYVQRHGVAHRVVHPERARPHGLELRRCLRIATCEQRDVVDDFHQLLAKPGYNAHCTPAHYTATTIRRLTNFPITLPTALL